MHSSFHRALIFVAIQRSNFVFSAPIIRTNTTNLCFKSALFAKLSQNNGKIQNKTAELSQRRPRDAPNIWVPSKCLRVLTTHPATYPEICNGLLFRSILRMCVQNLKFVALPVPEIIRGTQLGSPCIRPRSIFSQIFTWLLFAWTL